MRFEVETDTLRGFAARGFNGVWNWEVTRAGVGDEQIRVLLRSGHADASLANVIALVLREMSSVARAQAESMALEIEPDVEVLP